VLSSLIYLALCRLFALVVLLCQSQPRRSWRPWCSGTSWRFCVGRCASRSLSGTQIRPVVREGFGAGFTP
jgi:hypothetical protein